MVPGQHRRSADRDGAGRCPAAGASGIYDIRITNQDGEQIAEFRGHSRTVKGTHLPVEDWRHKIWEGGDYGKPATRHARAFDAIEIASRDEIAALQLARMKWSLQSRL